MSENDQLIQSFVAVTSAPKSVAEQFLEKNNGDLTQAIEDFYAANEGGSFESGSGSAEPEKRSLALKARSDKSKFRTLRDLNEDSNDPENTDTNFFTGGEKSALQVENPDKDKDKNEGNQPSLIERIFQRAQEQMDEPDDRPSAQMEPQEPSHFTGAGFKLGDSEQPLEVVADFSANARNRPAKVNREIIFWRQGFTVADGPLMRYDDPENQLILQELKRGRVPVSFLGVEYGQDVDVSVLKKIDEDYVPPKRKLGGFHGLGQRLGSPVPGESSGASTPVAEPKAEAKTEPAKPQDQGTGDSLVQIRFASGKKVAHKFNSTDSIETVYKFVRNHEYNSDQLRAFILSHAFPVKPIEESLGVSVEEAKLKNAVIVQRWA